MLAMEPTQIKNEETVTIPMFPNDRGEVDIPRFCYHSYGKLNADGSLTAYPLKERYSDASDGFPKAKRSGGFIWISPRPLSKDALVIDMSKLDPTNVRLTGQCEGYMLHHSDIPAEAILGELPTVTARLGAGEIL